MSDAAEFIRGQRDCREGKPHLSGQSEDYDRGYACEFEMAEIESARGAGNE